MAQQCWELLRLCWQWCAHGCNNSQHCWDLQCIVGRIQPISLCKPCVMSVRGHNNVGRAVQTDPTLLRYASVITEQKKCWELLDEKFDRFQTLRNNMQQGVETDATCNIQQCCVRLHAALYPSASVPSNWLALRVLSNWSARIERNGRLVEEDLRNEVGAKYTFLNWPIDIGACSHRSFDTQVDRAFIEFFSSFNPFNHILLVLFSLDNTHN